VAVIAKYSIGFILFW